MGFTCYAPFKLFIESHFSQIYHINFNYEEMELKRQPSNSKSCGKLKSIFHVELPAIMGFFLHIKGKINIMKYG